MQEARSVEAQLTDALPGMIRSAQADELKKALEAHLGETRSHLERMDAILSRHGAEPREHRDQSMQTILSEAEKWAELIEDPVCRDAAMIASAQRVEHYEIAVYGTLAAWAKQLDLTDDQSTLIGILDEERAADGILTDLAKREINAKAAA